MNKETREALELYVEKADELMASEFVKYVEDHGVKWHLSTERHGPTKTQINDFAVTFRPFVRDGDGISFCEFAKLCCDKSLSERWKREFKKARGEVNEVLKWILPIEVDGVPEPNMNRIMEVILFGDIIHLNPKKRSILKKWKGSGLYPAFESEFVGLLIRILHAINRIAQLSREELEAATSI